MEITLGTSEILTLIGLEFVFLGALGAFIKYLLGKIEKVREEMGVALIAIRENYVQKNDLMGHISRIEQGVDRTHKRLDLLFTSLVANKGGMPHDLS